MQLRATSTSSHGSLSHGPALSQPRGFQAETLEDCYLAGDSAAMQKVRSQLLRIAPYVRMALVVGEVGCGKQAVARALHDRSAGSAGPFVVQDASPFIESLVTEAQSIDALREAHGGTLFLSRVDGLSAALQARLLRLVRLHEELRSARLDLRIVSSSQRDLRVLAGTGLFHEELYRRIAAVEITLPPLRRRPEDILPIADALLRRLAIARTLTPEAIVHLQQHPWPENIRELRSTLERSARSFRSTDTAILAHGAAIGPGQLLLQRPEPPAAPTTAQPRLERLQDVVQRHVLEVLTHCSGNKLRASEVLGISRSTLYRMLDTCAVGSASEYSR